MDPLPNSSVSHLRVFLLEKAPAPFSHGRPGIKKCRKKGTLRSTLLLPFSPRWLGVETSPPFSFLARTNGAGVGVGGYRNELFVGGVRCLRVESDFRTCGWTASKLHSAHLRSSCSDLPRSAPPAATSPWPPQLQEASAPRGHAHQSSSHFLSSWT